MVKYIIFGIGTFIFLLLVLVLPAVIASRRKNTGTAGEDKTKKKKQKNITELIPIEGYDPECHCYSLKNKKYMDIIQINSKDLVNSSADDVEYDCLKFAKAYKLYEKDIKLLVLNFPCDTHTQQEYIRRKMSSTSNEIFRHYLQKRLDELVWIAKNNTTREFYFMVFADSTEEMEGQVITLKSVLHLGRDGLLIFLPDEKKHQILYRINNKNSMLV